VLRLRSPAARLDGRWLLAILRICSVPWYPRLPLTKMLPVPSFGSAPPATRTLSGWRPRSIIEAVATIGHAELKKNGVFVVPGLVRMVVVKKPATKERKGINPFTKEPTVFKAKPARKVIKGRPVKAAKDAVA